jgi:hypothetical protein
LTDILLNDHAEVDSLLRGVMLAFDGGDACEVFQKLDYLWARLAMHIRAEHLHLFPVLLSAASANGAGHSPGTPDTREVEADIEVLREDHDYFMRGLAEAVNGVRALTAPDCAADAGLLLRVREKVQAMAARLAKHNRLEEGRVYLWETTLLCENACAELRGRMKGEIENLPPRFAGDVDGE